MVLWISRLESSYMEDIYMEKAEKKSKEGIQLTIIGKIEALMEENKINQATLAREIGIGQAQLSKCLSHKGNNYISIDTLIKVADYFKVTADHLLGRTSLNSLSDHRSNTDICRNLIELIETNSVNVVNRSVEEDTYQPNKNSETKDTHPFQYEKKSNPYRMFYFSNYLPLPDKKNKSASRSELEKNGLYHPKGIEINAFLEYYLKLRDLYKKNELPQAFFEQAIEDRLNQMRY